MNDSRKHRLDRLRWRCRRGLLELELLLAPFVAAELTGLPEPLLEQFELLLEFDDVDVHEWLLGRGTPPDEVADIVAEIQGRHPALQ